MFRGGRFLGVVRLATAVCFLGALPPIGIVAQQWATSGTNIYNTNTGSVGIGTSTPSSVSKLHLFGGTSYVDLRIDGSGFHGDSGLRFVDADRTWKIGINVGQANAGNFNIYDLTGGGNRFTINSLGQVGIGTIAPAARLHVFEGVPLPTTAGGNLLLERVSATSANLFMRNVWLVRKAAGADWTTAKIHDAVSIDGAYLTPGTDTRVWWERDPWLGSQAWGNASTASPLMSLSGGGDLSVAGIIQAKYAQDVAEWVPAKRHISPGTVVVIDPIERNGVMPCTRSYDTSVAGVVSEKPGIILGEGSESKVIVATTGRVRVRVDATHAPVRTGDLLVTSDSEGTAMRSAPVEVGGISIHRPGTIIGKALEPLPDGQAEILVLLSLQ